jgi:hypothetical protein
MKIEQNGDNDNTGFRIAIAELAGQLTVSSN